MPITVTCQCGKRFRVKDKYAGKRGRCPACRAPVTIPRAAAGAGASEAPPVPAGPPAAGEAASTCPGCARPLAPGAVVCLNCGYDTRAGIKLRTVTGGSAAGYGKEARGWSKLPPGLRPYRTWTWLVPLVSILGAAVALGAGIVTGLITIHEKLPEDPWALATGVMAASVCFFGGAIVGALLGRLIARSLPR